MRHSILTILPLMILSATYGQSERLKDSSNSIKTEFKNQGEREDYWAKELFRKDYVREAYDLYSGKIVTIDNKNFLFGNRYLEVTNTPDSLMEIFSIGLLYPNLIEHSNDFTITNLEEVNFLTTDPTIKRFRFWLFRKGRANPQVIFLN